MIALAPDMIIIDITTTDETKKFSACERMAAAIVDLTRKNGGCLPQDLLTLGFTKNETIDLWQMSQVMANFELKIMEGESPSGFRWEKRHA